MDTGWPKVVYGKWLRILHSYLGRSYCFEFVNAGECEGLFGVSTLSVHELIGAWARTICNR